MSKLQRIVTEEGYEIYVETTDNITPPSPITESEEVVRGGAKGGWGNSPANQITQSFNAIEGTIKTYTRHTLNAFRDAALADVKKVTLEFGVNVSGVGGVPYIATGTAGCNIKVTVECAFNDRLQLPTDPAAPQ
jgi:hypothetical protein